jgi:Ala-tRNA(Pro) deacylase
MAIASTLQQYLADHAIEYSIMPHRPTLSSAQTVAASRIPPDSVAKAIVLKGDDGFLLAVVPASRHLDLGALRRELNRRLGLATEAEVAKLFGDCALGAVPPVGQAYGIDVVLDDEIAGQPDIFFEGGDHASLVHVKRQQFEALMAGVRHGQFTQPH